MGKNKINCWEFMKCGKEHDKENPCPVIIAYECEGINSSKMGGRMCWAVAGTFNTTAVCGVYAKQRTTCLSCTFFKKVMEEEGANFTVFLPPGEMEKLKDRLSKKESK